MSINPYKQSKDTCILLRGLLQAPKNHLVGLGSLTVLYIILHVMVVSLGLAIMMLILKRKEKKPNASLRSILITSILMEKRGEGGGVGGETDDLLTNLGK